MTPSQERIRNSLWFDLYAAIGRRLGFALMPLPDFIVESYQPRPAPPSGSGWVVGSPTSGPAMPPTPSPEHVRCSKPNCPQCARWVPVEPSKPAPAGDRSVGACGVPGCNCRSVSLGEQLVNDGAAEREPDGSGDPDRDTIDGVPVVQLRLAERSIMESSRVGCGADVRRFAVPFTPPPLKSRHYPVPGIKQDDLLRIEAYPNPATPDMMWLSVLALASPGPGITVPIAPAAGERIVVSATTLVPRELRRFRVCIDEKRGTIDVMIFDAVDVTDEVIFKSDGDDEAPPLS